MTRPRAALALAAVVLAVAGCGGAPEPAAAPPTPDRSSVATPSPRAAPSVRPTPTSTGAPTAVKLRVETVAEGLDTVWSLAFDPSGQLWWTERGGRLSRLDGPRRQVDGVVESGEGGLMGLEFDATGRAHLMYTAAEDNRVVRLDGERQVVLADGIPKGINHNGGRIRFGPDGVLYAATGDSGDRSLPQRRDSLAGKVLRVEPAGGAAVHSLGHRNIQGLCFDGTGRLLATEHGPERGDEVAVIQRGGDGGWPETTGNGLRSWTPTIAPAGCAFYDAAAIPQWRGSMFFVTLKERDLRRLTFGADGAVTGEEILYDREFGRLRDVAVGPDGFLYLATSNRDGRGDGSPDRIVRVRPA